LSLYLRWCDVPRISAILSFTLCRLVALAVALEDTEIADQCNSIASEFHNATNGRLWNLSLGTFSLGLGSPGNFSLTGTTWTILSRAANRPQVFSSLSKPKSFDLVLTTEPGLRILSLQSTNWRRTRRVFARSLVSILPRLQ
jgi:hypothetical protein